MRSLVETYQLINIYQLTEIASALVYLHQEQIIHGDLCGVRAQWHVFVWKTNDIVGRNEG